MENVSASDAPQFQIKVVGDMFSMTNIHQPSLGVKSRNWPTSTSEPKSSGAKFLFELISELMTLENKPVLVKSPQSEDGSYLAYSIWTRHERKRTKTKNSDNEDVWRILSTLRAPLAELDDRNFDSAEEVLSAETELPPQSTPCRSEPPSLLVIDDEGGIFRDSVKSWPEEIAGHEPIQSPVILKTTSPVAEGALWDRLKDCKDLTVVVSIEDLRERGADISSARSWEMTIETLLKEFTYGRSANDLGASPSEVVVVFPFCAVAVFQRKSQGLALQHFMYLPTEFEGEFLALYPGHTFGNLSLCTLAIVQTWLNKWLTGADSESALFRELCTSLKTARDLHAFGGGNYSDEFRSPVTPDRRHRDLFSPVYLSRKHGDDTDPDTILEELTSFERSFVLAGSDTRSSRTEAIKTLIELQQITFRSPDWGFRCIPTGNSQRYCKARSLHLIKESMLDVADTRLATAHLVVDFGELAAFGNLPVRKFGQYLSVHRQETEQLSELKALLTNYVHNDDDTRPFCLAIFGAPGSGKSFAFEELVKEVVESDRPDFLRFDLSQIHPVSKNLESSFETIRDSAISGGIPFVMWDEFDSEEFAWLKLFLGPMQDKRFLIDGRTHPFGKAVFAFAGGTASTFKSFEEIAMKAANRKAPDFLSRLRGYVDIQGINPVRSWKVQDGFDPYILRRAILLRTFLNRYHQQLFSKGFASTKNGVMDTLLRGVTNYKHGARSMEQIIGMTVLSEESKFRRIHLPSDSQFGIHADMTHCIDDMCEIGESLKTKVDGVAESLVPMLTEYGSLKDIPPIRKAEIRYQARVCLAIMDAALQTNDSIEDIANAYWAQQRSLWGGGFAFGELYDDTEKVFKNVSLWAS